MLDVKAIQSELRAHKMDGWLFYDILHRDHLAYRILGITAMAKRRWFYLIPAKGEPRKLVHRIEAKTLDALPGRKLEYAAVDELQEGNRPVARWHTDPGHAVFANNVPQLSLVDAGTVGRIRGLKKKVVSSADLVQKFEATWSPSQLESHLEAGKIIDRVTRDAFTRAGALIKERQSINEYELQQWMADQFRAQGVCADSAPVVAAGPNSSDSHYSPGPTGSLPIKEGSFLLLDVWGKLDKPDSVYYDITWTGYLGHTVPEKYAKVFRVVREARDTAVAFVKDSVAAGRTIHGWQVDDAARSVIRKAGYGKYFVHRTGHSIGQEVHGSTAPTWTAWKSRTTGRSSRALVSPSSPEFIWGSSACARKWMCTSVKAKRASPAPGRE